VRQIQPASDNIKGNPFIDELYYIASEGE